MRCDLCITDIVAAEFREIARLATWQVRLVFTGMITCLGTTSYLSGSEPQVHVFVVWAILVAGAPFLHESWGVGKIWAAGSMLAGIAIMVILDCLVSLFPAQPWTRKLVKILEDISLTLPFKSRLPPWARRTLAFLINLCAGVVATAAGMQYFGGVAICYVGAGFIVIAIHISLFKERPWNAGISLGWVFVIFWASFWSLYNSAAPWKIDFEILLLVSEALLAHFCTIHTSKSDPKVA
jgi:hypothetical protein